MRQGLWVGTLLGVILMLVGLFVGWQGNGQPLGAHLGLLVVGGFFFWAGVDLAAFNVRLARLRRRP